MCCSATNFLGSVTIEPHRSAWWYLGLFSRSDHLGSNGLSLGADLGKVARGRALGRSGDFPSVGVEGPAKVATDLWRAADGGARPRRLLESACGYDAFRCASASQGGRELSAGARSASGSRSGGHPAG